MTQQVTQEQAIELLRGEIECIRIQMEIMEKLVNEVREASHDGFSEMQRVARGDRLRILYVNTASCVDRLRIQFGNLHPAPAE